MSSLSPLSSMSSLSPLSSMSSLSTLSSMSSLSTLSSWVSIWQLHKGSRSDLMRRRRLQRGALQLEQAGRRVLRLGQTWDVAHLGNNLF